MAEAVLRHRAAAMGLDLIVESAGTAARHLMESPDPRACLVLLRRGYPVAARQARQVSRDALVHFDLVLGMTRGHVHRLRQLAPPEAQLRVDPLLAFARGCRSLDIPDPVAGDSADYERVLDLIEPAIDGLLDSLRASLG
jgi:protein-tyrosine phosphatase